MISTSDNKNKTLRKLVHNKIGTSNLRNEKKLLKQNELISDSTNCTNKEAKHFIAKFMFNIYYIGFK